MITNMEALYKAIKENSMLMNIFSEDMNLILECKKTVIVQKKMPSKLVINESLLQIKHPKVYLYTHDNGVWGECICELSLDNRIRNNDYYKENRYYSAPSSYSSKYYKDMYRKNPDAFKKEIDEWESEIDLNGTCLSYEEFRNYVGIGRYIFFKIKKMDFYDTSLPIDDFYIGKIGKYGIFESDEKFKVPRAWCYAVPKKG